MPLNKQGEPVLYKPWVNKTKSKYKYWVYVKKDGKVKKINFGDSRYKVFFEHKDKARQKSYLARAKGIKDKQGNLTWEDKNSANWWAIQKLW